MRIRVGTVEGGKGPIWATFPIVYHRPLPEGARIKGAWVQRRQVGAHWRWEFQVVLDLEGATLPAREAGPAGSAVGVDLGWRLMKEGEDPGRLRVACWSGSDGREGELALPSWWVREQRKVEDIHSIRVKNFDAARNELSVWLAGREIPDWFREAITPRDGGPDAKPSLSSWKSPGRLSRLVWRWKDPENRFEGDAEAFLKAKAWHRRDQHLLAYEANLRDQLKRGRLDLYRKFAARLRGLYAEVRIEDLDLRVFHELPAREETDEERAARRGVGDKSPAKLHARDACLSSLRGALKHACAVVELPAAFTTKDCWACGAEETWDAAAELDHVCSRCGERWDQDFNAARNLLRGPRGVRPRVASAPAGT